MSLLQQLYLVAPQENNRVMLTFGVIKINPQLGRYFLSRGHHHPKIE